MLNTSGGRTFAAILRSKIVGPLIEAEFDALRSDRKLGRAAVERERAAFEKHLRDIRRRRLARTVGKVYADLNSMTAPVFDAGGRILLTFTVFGPATTCSADWDGPIARGVAAAAARVMDKIGGVPPGDSIGKSS